MTAGGSVKLSEQAQRIVKTQRGQWYGSYGLCFCPAHADKRSPSLSVQLGHSAVLLKCWAGCETVVVLRALRRIDRRIFPPDRRAQVNDTRVQPAATSGLIHQLWSQSQPVGETLAARYLQTRGVSAAGTADLRFLARTKHGPTGTWLPAMVGALRDQQGRVTAIHRTFLDADSAAKAAVARPRLMLGAPGNAAIELRPPVSELGLAEGIEKALAAAMLTGCPTWSTWSAGQLAVVRIPERITRLRIFADNDRPQRNFPEGPGMHFARKAAAAHARPGRTISIEPPPPAFHDWDAYKRALDAGMVTDDAA